MSRKFVWMLAAFFFIFVVFEGRSIAQGKRGKGRGGERTAPAAASDEAAVRAVAGKFLTWFTLDYEMPLEEFEALFADDVIQIGNEGSILMGKKETLAMYKRVADQLRQTCREMKFKQDIVAVKILGDGAVVLARIEAQTVLRQEDRTIPRELWHTLVCRRTEWGWQIVLSQATTAAMDVTPLVKKAEGGDVAAMMELAERYGSGAGVPRDPTKAAFWLEKAAAAGNASAMVLLARVCEWGNGVPQDHARAVVWFQKAAAAGNAEGMRSLGWKCQMGEGIAKDEKEALNWYRKAVDAGSLSAISHVGGCYRWGIGIQKDEAEAVRWFRRGAEAGDMWSTCFLGEMYENGLGGLPKSRQDAVEWYRRAARMGHNGARENLKRLGEEP